MSEPFTQEQIAAALEDPDEGEGFIVRLYFDMPLYECAYTNQDGSRCPFSKVGTEDGEHQAALHVAQKHRKPVVTPPFVPSVPLFNADGNLIGTETPETDEESEDGSNDS